MSEIFRHTRFKRFNAAKMELQNVREGGISFLLKPTEGAFSVYDVWIHVTPSYEVFSNKHAVAQLRLAAEHSECPFTQIKLNGDDNINDQIFTHFHELSKNSPTRFTVFDILVNLRGHNLIAETLLNDAKNAIKHSIKFYNEESL